MPEAGAFADSMMLSDKTENILRGYTESNYYQLFEINFPVASLVDILAIVDTVQELKYFALKPGRCVRDKEKIKNEK